MSKLNPSTTHMSGGVYGSNASAGQIVLTDDVRSGAADGLALTLPRCRCRPSASMFVQPRRATLIRAAAETVRLRRIVTCLIATLLAACIAIVPSTPEPREARGNL